MTSLALNNWAQLFSVLWVCSLLARINTFSLFVCVEVLQPSQPNGVMSSADSFPSWLCRKERMTIENISRSISTKECCWPGGGRTHNLLITSQRCNWAVEASTNIFSLYCSNFMISTVEHYRVWIFRKVLVIMDEITSIFTLSIGTPSLLTTLVLKFEIVHSITSWYI